MFGPVPVGGLGVGHDPIEDRFGRSLRGEGTFTGSSGSGVRN